MGSYSHLRVQNLNVDWSKNSLVNHSVLFSTEDFQIVPYTYADSVQMKPGYSRPLVKLIPRLNLLGFTEIYLRSRLEEIVTECIPDHNQITFEHIADLINDIDLSISTYDEAEEWLHYSELTAKIRFMINSNRKYESLRPDLSGISDVTEQLHPYEILSIFARDSSKSGLDVVWEYHDLVSGGWVEENEVFHDIGQNPPYLLITEGSSDSAILKNAIQWIYPDLSGFFDLIDMDKNYPFTGVGNMVNFYHGLCKIGVSRTTLFILDNDVAGHKAFKRCKLSSPNLSVITLPEHPAFSEFPTVGPTGVSVENVNGTAVSIEMFLDLQYRQKALPRVRWRSYDDQAGRYQGVLEGKQRYQKLFHSAYKSRDPDYSKDKLKFLIDTIIDALQSNSLSHQSN